MTIIANTAVALVAALHFGFLVLEMFLWTRPLGLRTFGTTPDFARASKALAANQGCSAWTQRILRLAVKPPNTPATTTQPRKKS